VGFLPEEELIKIATKKEDLQERVWGAPIARKKETIGHIDKKKRKL